MGEEGPALAAAKREALRRLDELTEEVRSAFFDAARHGRLSSSSYPEHLRQLCYKGFVRAAKGAATTFVQIKGRRALNHVDSFRGMLNDLRMKVLATFDEFDGSGSMNTRPALIRSTLEGQLVKISEDTRDDLQVGVYFVGGTAEADDVAAADGSLTGVPLSPSTNISYVSSDRLAQLRSLPSTTLDFSRLVRLCEETNSCFEAGNYIAVAALLRTIKEHVPPALGFQTFSEYSAQANGKSHKGSIERLDRSVKDIADQWLHGRIRAREALPTSSQVDFRQDLDVLLGEVVRLNK